ncbi:MAG: UDP-N-acetylglucosamine 2-epimerase (non-hydrolyzing) [Anaerolineaceae bacterium]|nr:MAG: UDP-N-acetylglucosamine 2-epimerase (non-hydrolyzing) [Anaerolineaceae bacterium]
MKVVTIVGARPQFIKAAPVSKALREAGHTEFLLHTGQHYDCGMSQVFFDELGLPVADVNLNVRSGNHGQQTGQMLIGIEEVLLAEKPDWVLVYGDTNSTLAGALAAVKLHIPLAHVEAGLRSFNREMPEEHNRVLTDYCADMLFCPTQTAVDNLSKAGITHGVHLVGDTMYDAVLQFGAIARQRSTILQELGLQPKGYLLATVHRQANTDNAQNLRNILAAFTEIEELIIFPVHPRTRQKIAELGLDNLQSKIRNPKFIEPVGYLDMLMLEQSARMILTDSGGIQKEAYWLGVQCVTLRGETEWVETIQSGWNMLVGADREKIKKSVRSPFFLRNNEPLSTKDRVANRIIFLLHRSIGSFDG